jgi:hypothetical protein
MRTPLGISLNPLIAIFGLIDKLFDLSVFPNGERGKGVTYSAARLFATPRSKSLQPQPNDSFIPPKTCEPTLSNSVGGHYPRIHSGKS